MKKWTKGKMRNLRKIALEMKIADSLRKLEALKMSEFAVVVNGHVKKHNKIALKVACLQMELDSDRKRLRTMNGKTH